MKTYSTEYLREKGFDCSWSITAKGIPIIEMKLTDCKILLDEITWKRMTERKLTFNYINENFNTKRKVNIYD